MSNGMIVVASDDGLTLAIDEKHAAITALGDEKNEDTEVAGVDLSKQPARQERDEDNTAGNAGQTGSKKARSGHQIYHSMISLCSKPWCFNHSYCTTYTHCYVCSLPKRGQVRGRCI